MDHFLPATNSPQKLTLWEKNLRNQFVDQFVIDYDYVAAACRVGFAGDLAVEYAHRFRRDPYVQNLIIEKKAEKPIQDKDFMREKVVGGLLKEAHNHEHGSSHSARVGAFAHIGKLVGLEAPTKVETKVEHSGSVSMPIDYSKCSDEELDLIHKLLKLRVASEDG